jgi:tetratricopeptide (TPR) repeat protein
MRRLALIVILALCGALAFAQNPLSFTLEPSGELPLANERFTMGGGLLFGAEYRLGFLPFLAPRLDLAYSYLPTATESGVNMIRAGGGLALRFGDRISAHLAAGAGYYYGSVGGEGGGNFYVRGAARAEYALTDSLAIGGGASYQWLADGAGGALWSGLGASIGVRYTVLTTRRLQIEEPLLEPIFPVLYKYYAGESIGALQITNPGSVPMTNVRVSFYVEEYMTGPTVTRLPNDLAPGATADLPIRAVFSDEVLSITEGDVVSGRFAVSYETRDREHEDEITAPIEFYDRHSITWTDDRRAAAYVTARDPAILQLARPIASWVRGQQISFDSNMQIAMAVHTTLGKSGVNYLVDPRTPYADFSQDQTAVDYLQFPINTLEFRAGDCDDLSILYAAMLQAVGVETAFLTIPGHIYIAFALKMPPDEARATFLRPEDVIDEAGTAWIPLEVTLVGDSFLEAWTAGAEEWRVNAETGQADIYSIAEAWKVYDPVEAIATGARVELPDPETLASDHHAAWSQFVDRETRSRVSALQSRIAGSTNSARYENSLGVLYARYGLIDRAEEVFASVVSRIEFTPSLINLANVLVIQNRTEEAIGFYERALEQDPDNPIALLQLARTAYALGRMDEAAGYVAELRPIAPELVAQHAYLDSAQAPENRAAARDQLLEVTLWDEE